MKQEYINQLIAILQDKSVSFVKNILAYAKMLELELKKKE